MSLTYIKQRGPADCGIAALAMACGLTYDRVWVDLGGEVEAEKGVNDSIVKEWLFRNDWAWQEVTRSVWKRGSFHPLVPWPPRPFAVSHVCFVEATAGWHYCAMDFAGRVFDPWDDQRGNLGHPDYKRVSSVLGLFKIGARRDRVGG